MNHSFRFGILVAVIIGFGGCANPLNRATHDNYKKQGREAEARGDAAAAEIAYSRALTNAQLGNLGPELEADALFDLGRMKRVVGKLDESEELLKKALVMDEQMRTDALYRGFIQMELARTYFERRKLEEGIPLLNALEPIAARYRGKPRVFLKKTYDLYSDELSSQGRAREADRFKNIAASL